MQGNHLSGWRHQTHKKHMKKLKRLVPLSLRAQSKENLDRAEGYSHGPSSSHKNVHDVLVLLLLKKSIMYILSISMYLSFGPQSNKSSPSPKL